MATIPAIEDQGNFLGPFLVTSELVVMSDPVASATKDPGLFGCFKKCCCSPVFWLWLGWCCNPSKLRSCSPVSKPVSSFLAENDTFTALVARIIT